MSEVSTIDVPIPEHRRVTRTPEGIRFSVTEAKDALARSDDGDDPMPGDAELIEALEGWCQQEQAKREDEWRAAEYAEWLATQCRHCGPEGSTGDDCGDCPEGGEQA